MVAAGSSLKASEKSDGRPNAERRVLIADDDSGFRTLVSQLVEAADGLGSVHAVCSGEEAVEVAAVFRPNLALIDVVMPGLGGIEAARQIKEAMPWVVVILISTTHPDDLPQAASTCDADAVVWKAALRPALLEEIWQRHRP